MLILVEFVSFFHNFERVQVHENLRKETSTKFIFVNINNASHTIDTVSRKFIRKVTFVMFLVYYRGVRRNVCL